MSKEHNCPNCGAVLDKDKYKCSYCGTLYYDLSTIPIDGTPFYLKLRTNDGKIYTNKVMCVNTEISVSPISVDVYRDYKFRFQRLYEPHEETVELDFREARE